jgi:hypothetical protein
MTLKKRRALLGGKTATAAASKGELTRSNLPANYGTPSTTLYKNEAYFDCVPERWLNAIHRSKLKIIDTLLRLL